MKNTEEFLRHFDEKQRGKGVILGDNVYLLDMINDDWVECQLFKMEINPNSDEVRYGDFVITDSILYSGQAKDDDREIKSVECYSQVHYNKSLIRYLRQVKCNKLYYDERN